MQEGNTRSQKLSVLERMAGNLASTEKYTGSRVVVATKLGPVVQNKGCR